MSGENISSIAQRLGVGSKKDLKIKLADAGVAPKDVNDKNLTEVNKALRGAAQVAQSGGDPTSEPIEALKASDPGSVDEKPKKTNEGQRAIYGAIIGALPVVLGAAFGGKQGGAIGADAGAKASAQYFAGQEKKDELGRLEAKNQAEKTDKDRRFGLDERKVVADETSNKNKAEELKVARAGQQNEKRMAGENSMRDDFMKSDIVKQYHEASAGLGKMREIIKSKDKGGANDIALVYAFMKAQDPGSVVREGEYATAQKYSGGLADSYGIKLDRLLGGKEVLTDAQRRSLMNAAETVFKTNQSQFDAVRSQFVDNAKRRGYDPDQIAVSYQAAPAVEEPLKKDLTQPGAEPPGTKTVMTRAGEASVDQLRALKLEREQKALGRR